MELIRVMEVATLVITLFMFMSGIMPCHHMYKTGDTKNVPYLMFLLGAVSCAGMLHYGLMIGVGTLVFLNVVGTALNFAYTAVYIMVIKDKFIPVVYLSLSTAYMIGLYSYMYMIISNEETRAAIIGGASSAITTFIMTLPLFELVDNFKNKNADGMPLIMLLSGGACSLSWLVYGLLLKDANVYSPNIPGLVITALKLVAISMYSTSDKKKVE